jgi:hypothetical protein
VTSWRRALVTMLAAIGLAIAVAPPASAHTGASNDRAVLSSVEPRVKGLRVRVLDRARISIENHTGERVLVLGYSGEPYLRLERRSVFVNELSPSTYLNRSYNPKDVPDSFDAAAPPRWKRLATKKDGASWHDHRLHRTPFAQGSARWDVAIQVGDRPVAITGDIVRDDPPAPLPWLLLGVAAFAGLLAFAGRRPEPREPLLVGLGVLFLTAQTVALGAGGALPVVAALSVPPAAAAVWFLRAPIAAGLAGALGVGAGLTGVGDLRYAHMNVAIGDALFRGSVVLTVGVGAGLLVLAARAVGVVRPAAAR